MIHFAQNEIIQLLIPSPTPAKKNNNKKNKHIWISILAEQITFFYQIIIPIQLDWMILMACQLI